MFNVTLKKLLNSNNMSNYALAKKLSVSESTIANWLKGSSTPKIEYIIAMTEIFNVSPSFIMGLSDEPKNPLSKENQELIELVSQLTDEEVKEVSNFVDYLVSKRE